MLDSLLTVLKMFLTIVYSWSRIMFWPSAPVAMSKRQVKNDFLENMKKNDNYFQLIAELDCWNMLQIAYCI